ncbi:MAG TPA: acetyl-CoA carboxylase biotin carboxyl carrier protein subunit [Nitrososphaeraceae archaeon]|jgi:biotin carboxyl carrier protein|nr:acetyl-CoA carboxylase biotin carboxyl carrier protein subunit [Nitrososphaeraceae archaeon]
MENNHREILMELKVSDITEVLDCEIVRTLSDGSIIIRIGTEQHNLNLLKSENNEYEFILDHTFHHAKIIQSNSMETKTLIDGQPMTVKKHLKLTQVLGKSLSLAELGGGINSLTSQIPGRVVSVLVETGSPVKKGDAVVVLESMKMQVAVKAHKDGNLKEIKVKQGAAVARNDVIAIIE